jgi:predicted nucleic acid-binding protein
MEASLDTNVIIHLYRADFQSVLLNRFSRLKVYEFIRTEELKKHAEQKIINLFDKDIDDGNIELITNG